MIINLGKKMVALTNRESRPLENEENFTRPLQICFFFYMGKLDVIIKSQVNIVLLNCNLKGLNRVTQIRLCGKCRIS